MQLSRLCSETLIHLATLDRSPHTIVNYDIAYRQLVAYLTVELQLTDDCRHLSGAPGTERLMGWMDWMKAHGAQANSILSRLSALPALVKRGMLRRDGRDHPMIAENPLLGLDRPKRRRPLEKFLLPAELGAWLAVPRPKQNQRIVRAVLIDTGLRVGELSSANVGSLLTVDGVTWLAVQVKGGATKRFPLSPAIAAAVFDWLLARNMPDPEEPLFLDERGARYRRQAIEGLVFLTGRAAGIDRFDARPHVIRHTLEYLRARAGIRLEVRLALMGHSFPGSLGPYQHVLPEELLDGRRRQVAELLTYVGTAGYATQLYEAPDPGVRK